jgi:protein-S-isoprenylcysteine O-methyltransferase Ste14
MIQITQLRTTLLVGLAASFGVGWVALFAFWPLGSLRIVSPRWSEATIFLWDAALSLLFFLQHSGMARTKVRTRVAVVTTPIYQPAIYAISSGIVLVTVLLLWQPSAIHLFALARPWRYVAQGFSIASLLLFVWAFRSLRAFDPLGLSPLIGHLRSKPFRSCAFAATGAYRLVRHPLYLAAIVLLWSCPDVNADRLLFNGLWTAWIVAATFLEEVDLIAEFGDTYRFYRRSVPMLIPLTRTRSGRHEEEEQLPS